MTWTDAISVLAAVAVLITALVCALQFVEADREIQERKAARRMAERLERSRGGNRG